MSGEGITPVTGGCQCGAIRYRAASLGRASICHCRMCQKAFGSFFGPLVSAVGFTLTRGNLKTFASSNKVTRGFCGDCGTPLTYDWGGDIEVAIGTLDEPRLAAPSVQVDPTDKLPFVDGLPALPVPERSQFLEGIVSHQHPDHDTDAWPATGA